MYKYLLAVLFLITLCFTKTGFAQEEDSTNTEETWDNDDWNFESDSKDSEWMDFEFHGRPTIEASYGLSNVEIKSLSSDFIKPGAVDVRLGYSTMKEYDGYIIKYRHRFLSLANFTKDLSNSSIDGKKLDGNVWRIGVGWLEGYGYQFGRSAIIPYTTNSFVWSRLKLNDLDRWQGVECLNIHKDLAYLKYFNDTFRFGTSTEAGIRFQPIPLVSINAGYERTLVFPRHLFWKHLGSMIIEWAGLGATDLFVREIMEETPAAGPIINLLLKSGVSYGIYQLRREKMNWPFDSAEPLTLDTWRFGVTFTF
ncbi:MAG: hypothetical protein NTX22_08635 [Ignavibacteriales bacterium]|nr:hypothetical protein [Ignavibacteriales bacterium]